MKKDSEVFRDAHAILLTRGLAKNQLIKPDGSVCINGACNLAAHGWARNLFNLACNYQYNYKLGAAAASLGLPLRGGNPSYGNEFNDHDDASLESMLSVLERAQKFAEQREATST